jgi:hypothetical protein
MVECDGEIRNKAIQYRKKKNQLAGHKLGLKRNPSGHFEVKNPSQRNKIVEEKRFCRSRI